MTERAKQLFYVGQRDAEGNPTEYFPGVPARDLEAEDIARLNDHQYAEVAGSALYQKSKPRSRDDRETTSAASTAADDQAKRDALNARRREQRQAKKAADGAVTEDATDVADEPAEDAE